MLEEPQLKRERVRALVCDVLARSPREFGHARSRWSLGLLGEHFEWLESLSESGLSRWFKRAGLSFQRAREYIHSPDQEYQAKAQYLREQLEVARRQEELVYFWDGMSIQLDVPGQAKCWRTTNSDQARVRCPRQQGGKRCHRLKVLGVMQARSARVKVWYPQSLDRSTMLECLEQLSQMHPGQQVRVVLDNAPIHFHQDVLKGLEAQQWPFEYVCPYNWPDPQQGAEHHGELPIQLIPLPTYSPWLNPIEKLWKMLRQRVLHLHPHAHQPNVAQQLVEDFFEPLEHAIQPELRSYTGLNSIFPV